METHVFLLSYATMTVLRKNMYIFFITLEGDISGKRQLQSDGSIRYEAGGYQDGSSCASYEKTR